MEERDKSCESLLGVVVIVYWFLYFVVSVFDKIGKFALLWVFITIGVLMIFFKWFHRWEEGQFERIGKQSNGVLPFFVKGQCRRRKLDMTRKENLISDDTLGKWKKESKGIFRIG